MDKLFKELRRRNVFRIAGVYAVISWLLVQIAVALEAALEMPSWFDAVVTSLLLIGFPIALIFAWAFEMTPQGVKRTAAVNPEESITDRTGRKLDYALLGGLVIVAAIVLGDRFIPRLDDNGPAAQVAAADAEAPKANLDDKSIAVLPFDDMSPEGDQEYFADGLSEELLNVLAQIDGLQIAGRTSSFAFKGDNRDLREIGDILNVAHILEGSVRKAGNRIRVTAQLINTSTGYHVYSETFEGDLSDIFAVQDEIATDIAKALRTEWLGEDAAEEDAPSDFAAFDLYLQARQLIYTRQKEKMEEAERLLDRAVEIDPAYAPAWAQKAIVNMLLSDSTGSYGDRPHMAAAAQSMIWADKAIALDPTLGDAHAAKGFALSYGAELDATVLTLRRAIELNPGLSDAKNWLAIALENLGRLEEGLSVRESIVENDPFYGPAFNNLVNSYAYLGEFEKAESLIARMERLSGETVDTMQARGMAAEARGGISEAARLYEKALALEPENSVIRSSYVIQLAKLGELEKALEEAVPFQRPILLMLMGRYDEAMALFEQMPTPEEGGLTPLSMTAFGLGFSNRHKELLDYLDRHFDSIDDAVSLSVYGSGGWLPFAAAAYREAGRTEEMEKAISYYDQALQPERDMGAADISLGLSEARLDSLRGDTDAAVENLQKAMDAGLIDDMMLRTSVFDSVRGDPRFKEIEVEMNERINKERQDFGLPDRQGG